MGDYLLSRLQSQLPRDPSLPAGLPAGGDQRHPEAELHSEDRKTRLHEFLEAEAESRSKASRASHGPYLTTTHNVSMGALTSALGGLRTTGRGSGISPAPPAITTSTGSIPSPHPAPPPGYTPSLYPAPSPSLFPSGRGSSISIISTPSPSSTPAPAPSYRPSSSPATSLSVIPAPLPSPTPATASSIPAPTFSISLPSPTPAPVRSGGAPTPRPAPLLSAPAELRLTADEVGTHFKVGLREMQRGRTYPSRDGITYLYRGHPFRPSIPGMRPTFDTSRFLFERQ